VCQSYRVMGLTLHVIDGDRATDVPASYDGGVLSLTADALESATGWRLRSHGLCRGDVCVPAALDLENIALQDVAQALHRPLAVEVLDGSVGIAAAVLGEPGETTVALDGVAPLLSLPDVDGALVPVTGSGRKTAIVAWSTWCGCRYELPAWKQIAEELAADGLDVVTVAIDEDREAVRPWAENAGVPVAVDAEHRLSDIFGIVNVPSTVWLDEEGRVVKPPTIAPGDDQFREFTELDSQQHHEALRRWVRTGEVPTVADAPTADDDLRAARAARRLAAWLHRAGHAAAAERHFTAAVELAPLDFTIRRASMPLRGQDPFGSAFFELWEAWNAAGRPGYLPMGSGA
jgi:thiol-disulfide isomerase/thioredoxin